MELLEHAAADAAAIEIKASERYKGRLGVKEIIDDVLKLDAHRLEARH